MKARIEKVAGAIAGEHASGAIGAVRGGRQANDEKLRVAVSETGHWPPPIGVLAERATLGPRDLFSMRYQAGTLRAGDDAAIQNAERKSCHARKDLLPDSFVSFPRFLLPCSLASLSRELPLRKRNHGHLASHDEVSSRVLLHLLRSPAGRDLAKPEALGSHVHDGQVGDYPVDAGQRG